MKIPVLLGTSRQRNESQKVARYIHEMLNEQGGIESEFLDLGSTSINIMTHRLQDLHEPGIELLDWHDKIKECDALIIVTPEYKSGYPGSLKNFLDYLPAGILRYKAIGIVTVSSGESGGASCLAQLRLVCIAMGGMVIPDRLQISRVKEKFTDSGLQDESISPVANKWLYREKTMKDISF